MILQNLTGEETEPALAPVLGGGEEGGGGGEGRGRERERGGGGEGREEVD